MNDYKFIKVHDEHGDIFVSIRHVYAVGVYTECLQSNFKDSKATIYLATADNVIQTRETQDEVMALIEEQNEPSWR